MILFLTIIVMVKSEYRPRLITVHENLNGGQYTYTFSAPLSLMVG